MRSRRVNKNVVAHHNGDYSGDVIFAVGFHGEEIRVPFEWMQFMVAEKIRDERMSALEDATTEELLK